MQRPRLLVIGDIAWDIVIRPQTGLVWGSDAFGAVELMPGGSAANVAVWARRLGADVRLVGKVGDDLLGGMMLHHLKAEGLDGSVRTVEGGSTTRIGVVVSPTGEHAFVTDHTSLLAFQSGDLPHSLLDGIDGIFFNGYGIFASRSADFITGLLADAHRRGIPAAFDPSSFELIRAYGPPRLLDEVGTLDLIIANEDEARVLCEDQPIEMLLQHANLVVIKQGPKGATAVSRDDRLHSPAGFATPVDSTGAGDAFDAAFLVEYLRSTDVPRALRLANRLGAYVTGSLGAQPPAPAWLAEAR